MSVLRSPIQTRSKIVSSESSKRPEAVAVETSEYREIRESGGIAKVEDPEDRGSAEVSAGVVCVENNSKPSSRSLFDTGASFSKTIRRIMNVNEGDEENQLQEFAAGSDDNSSDAGSTAHQGVKWKRWFTVAVIILIAIVGSVLVVDVTVTFIFHGGWFAPHSSGAPAPSPPSPPSPGGKTFLMSLRDFDCEYGTEAGNICRSDERSVCVRLSDRRWSRPGSVIVRAVPPIPIDLCQGMSSFEEA